eukprot:TRINITY_DN16988_c0_g1_i1.p1 TRINITY_DN16988_c0_g1~~TRINITY_DN16988_c0_g1_i1.p1  ORF type:complete len:272 (-),score=68.29 TRINITY_DN16988_c0_g1_i1:293-1108(-)
MEVVLGKLQRVQALVDFEGAVSPPFVDPNGAGRHGIAGLAVGCTFGFSLAVVLLGGFAGLPVPAIQWFGYTMLLSVFHAGEWYITAAYRPNELEYKSWIINHSVAYTAVQIASVVEFWLEFMLFPWIKASLWLMLPSTLLAVVAIGIRIVGMAQCGDNFDHIVMTEKKQGHELVTHGIYRHLRHPSYFGFYYWSVAAQLLLANPIMAVACAVASRHFFAGRIPPEEKVLVEIYGEQYVKFASNTPIGIPFVKGHVAYGAPAPVSKADKKAS